MEQIFRVVWEIDIYAETAEEAALKALKIQRDPNSIATYFHVLDQDGQRVSVDLEEIGHTVVAPAQAESADLALVPDAPDECEGSDFTLKEGAPGAWVSVDGASIHICRGSYPNANDGGLRVNAYRNGEEFDGSLGEIVLAPGDLCKSDSYVIYSPSEAIAGFWLDAGYWSNTDGWTTIDGATRFSAEEKGTMSLPLSTGSDARWVAA